MCMHVLVTNQAKDISIVTPTPNSCQDNELAISSTRSLICSKLLDFHETMAMNKLFMFLPLLGCVHVSHWIQLLEVLPY
jgi:hypothetical protein